MKIYAGGYNCIHSWLWVEPEWDDDLNKMYIEERSAVEITEDGQDITVFQ